MFFAVKEAILSARKETGNSGKFRLDSPATPERVRMACEDEFTDMVGRSLIAYLTINIVFYVKVIIRYYIKYFHRNYQSQSFLVSLSYGTKIYKANGTRAVCVT